MIDLKTLKPAAGAKKKAKRVGRGNASGHGTYSTRGLKGQKSRTGVKREKLKRLGMRSMLLGLPKNRGFVSAKPKDQAVNLADLNKFKANALVDPISLAKAGLIGDAKQTVKILGRGELKAQGLRFAKVKMSESAKQAIEAAGGKIQ